MYSSRSSLRSFAPLRWLWMGTVLCLTFSLSACGFRIKGPEPLPFDTLYTNISDNSLFGAQLRRVLIASSPTLKFVEDSADAEAHLIQLSNQRFTRELSIDPQGHVEEYELTVALSFQLLDSAGHVILPPTLLQTVREVPHDPNAVQAKQGEIATLFLAMEQSLIDRLVRRLSAPDVEENFRNASQLPTAVIDDYEELGQRPETLPLPNEIINPRSNSSY
ncbi:LPS assembly lipoprotein LptE [Paenalcaligenes niemegkensis]|uniref:LPS-assembly lipoprotein LptE n=1 Tax=Paenalcaligenes niemegkensis TaxID=2895469 RepID=UPI001EE912D4|nr:LPS assembly lipoprotein LptE [Paenalcaligenes niemegkensis]MCQ9616850.1 LPS assembly lipoprotein LptE [Paenalcaligenes niemegkensis]